MLPVIFHELAVSELNEASAYYAQARRGLGEAFIAEVEQAVAALAASPHAGTEVESDVRWWLVKRFPTACCIARTMTRFAFLRLLTKVDDPTTGEVADDGDATQQADGADRSRFTHYHPAAPDAAAHRPAVRRDMEASVTGQIDDAFQYRDRLFDLTSSSGSGLFDPAGQDVVAEAWSTACWRGYHCTYEIVAGSLYLTQINLGLDADSAVAAARGEGPKLFGKVPRRYADHYDGSESRDFVVDDLRENIQFTGGLLLVDEFVGEPYFHMGFGMGFHPAYQFRIVHELIFDSGRLVKEHDRSAQMAELRKVIPARVSHAESEAGMKGGFRFDYGFF